MKAQIKLFTFALAGLLFAQGSLAQPLTNTRCMPAVLDFVMQDFDQTVMTTGLIVPDPEGKLKINLGHDISFDSVSITDVHKDSYYIDIPLNFINSTSTDFVVWTYVMIDSYSNCRIKTEKPVYGARKRRH